MKILVVTNLYPPHHAGTFDQRCYEITEALKLRGHVVRVLTSNHGLTGEQKGGEVERRLWLNGSFGHAAISRFKELERLEMHNHRVFRETVSALKPDLIHCYGLEGISKSLIFALRQSRVPTVYAVSDYWLAKGVREDPWLAFWNRVHGPLGPTLGRAALELTGRRNRLDSLAPTRMMKGYERVPQLWGRPREVAHSTVSSVSAFRFDRLYFCSQSLKDTTAEAGFRVDHGEVIYPGIDSQTYVGEVKPATDNLSKFLLVAHLDKHSGATTAVEALNMARQRGSEATLSIYGRGNSEYIAGLRSFAAANQLPVEFLPVSNLARDLPAIYKRHDALIHPIEWNEPFSTAPLEALACGLPVIASTAGGVAELLRHRENALVFAPGDAAALAQHIEELERNTALRLQIAEAGQQEILSKYNQAAVIDRIESYLQQSLEVWAHAAS